MSIIKYHINPSQDSNGNPTVVCLDHGGMKKTAGYDNFGNEMREFLASIKPKEGYAYLLIAAMGDQNWGPNRNGDYWPTIALSNSGPDFGYKTYEENGNWYHHHVNKDKANSYGKVIKSVWNDQMGRIELIVEVDLSKDDKTRAALQNNETIQTSMGARIKWDCCVICHPNWKEFYKIPEEDMIIISKETSVERVHEIGKKHGVDLSYITKMNPDGGPVGIHSNMSKYCDHMKRQKLQTLGTGQQVCVANPRPSFFDISYVTINADKSSFVLAKVAELTPSLIDIPNEDIPDDVVGSPIAANTTANVVTEEIKTSGTKSADQVESPGDNEIEKQVEGGEVIADDYKDIEKYYTDHICPEMYRKEKELPDRTVDDMAGKYSFPEIISTFLAMGMFPHPREFQRIVMIQMGKRDELDAADRDGDFLRLSDIPHTQYKEDSDERAVDVSPEHVNGDLMSMLKHFFWERSAYRQPMVRRMFIVKRANDMNAYINPYTEIPGKRSFAPGLLAALGTLYAVTALDSKKKVGDVVQDVTSPAKSNWMIGKVGMAVAAAILANKIIGGMQKEKYEESVFDAKRASIDVNIPRNKVDAPKAATKTKGLTAWQGTKLVGPYLGTYLLGGHIINKAQSGQHITPAEEFVAKHPIITGGVATLAVNSPKATAAVPGKILKGVASIFKKAEMGMDMSEINIDDLPLEERDLGGIAVWGLAGKGNTCQ